MTNNPRTRWDIKRFLQTLNYFEIIPNLSFLTKWINRRGLIQENKNQDAQMDIIIIGDATGTTGQQVIEQLLEMKYRVRAIVQDATKAKEILGNQVELFVANPNIFETLIPQFLENVQEVIYLVKLPFTESETEAQSLKNTVKFIKKYLRSGEKILFDFTKPNENIREIWGAVDDVVMGGVSESNIRLVGGRAIFTGNVSTANNGGFASVRTRNFNPPLDLSTYEGIEIRVEGDGKRYKFITRCEDKWDGLSYCYSFDTIYNFAQTIQIPFKDLIPVFRAKTVNDAGEFNSSQVYSMQFMQSKFEYDGALNPRFSPGLFGLQIESIKAYGKKTISSELIIVAPKELALETDNLFKNSSLNYTIIHCASDAQSIREASKLSIQALENSELCNQTIKI